LDDSRLIQALLQGGTTPIYRCNNAECLNPSRTTVTISAQQSLVTRVQLLLEQMLTHIKTDTALSPDEIALLNATKLPLYKMLSVEAAFYSNASVLNLSDYADAIALDWLYQYLQEQLTLIEIGSASLQFPAEITQQFHQQLQQAKQKVNQLRTTTAQREQVTTQLIEKTQRLEQQLLDGLVSELVGSQKY
jgi:conjugative transfer pilus assembly protein TraH